jgi:predicted TIM-barrel fold metal-dependent hydrolase
LSTFRVISSDSHLNEPLEIYARLPEVYRHRAPRVEVRDGERYQIVEGQPPFPIEAPNPISEDDKRRYWREDGDGDVEVGRVFHRAGGTDVSLRLRDQDEDGIGAEVIYPHGIFNTFSSPDPAFQLALARVYNDYYHEIFGAHPDRFVVSAVLPMLDVDGAVAEAQRLAKLGFRSASIPLDMRSRPYSLPTFEPVWSAIEDTGLVLGLHTFTFADPEDEEGPPRAAVAPGADLANIVVYMGLAMKPLCELVASGVLERHPKLKFVLVECGIGWLAWVLQTLDQMQKKRHMWMEPRLALRPSEYFRRQGAATFSDDEVGLRNRDVTSVDCLLWGNDYPHDEGTFPHSREAIERTFRGVPEAEKRKMLGENAARLYSL